MNKNQTIKIIYISMMFASCLGVIVTLFGSFGKEGYILFGLLPLSYVFFLVMGQSVFNQVPQNIGVTVLIFIQFIRLVLSPVLVVSSGYIEVITYNSSSNMPLACILMLMESFAITIALISKMDIKAKKTYGIDDRKCNQKMTMLMLFIILLTAVVCRFAPEILRNYRTILGVFTDAEYSNVEQAYIVNQYASGFFKKLMLVLANYILKVMRILLPTFIMVWLYIKSGKYSRPLAMFLVFSPLILVDGAIARSIYFTLFLLIIYNHLFGIDIKKLYIPMALGGIFVIVYFIVRYRLAGGNNTLLQYFAEKSVDYFAGANIVAGSQNLPPDISTRAHYLIGEFIRSIPFCNTLFGLDSADTVQFFFNKYNMTSGGQIPTTIGMSSYYLSIFFAPVFSFWFARMTKKYGIKMNEEDNPYYKLIYLYISFISALGIGMYNIEITLGTIVQVIFPIFVVARLAYPLSREE